MKSSLVSKKDIQRAIGLNGVAGKLIAPLTMRALGISRVNKKYAKVAKYSGRDFTVELLKELNVKYDVPQNQMEYIPQTGPFIIVANHPFGAIEGILMINIISAARPDVKFITNFMLSKIPNLKEFFLPVNPFSDRPGLKKSFGGIRMATETLQNGNCLCIFPAGEVSAKYPENATIQDKKWQPTMIKLAKKAGVPIIPAYVHGCNSNMFHIVGKVHPLLRTASLPRQLLNKEGQTISIRFGKPISPKEAEEYADIDSFGRYLRSRTYCMEANIEKETKSRFKNELEPLALARNRAALFNEINSISSEDELFSDENYACYLLEYQKIPLLMHELGRKREEAFRSVGEGTGKSLDIDRYDEYYKHLILWDKAKSRLVGAYRLGYGREILEQRGFKGFYSQSLFTYTAEFESFMRESMELGRSFVSIEYQKDPFALLGLIKGLLYSMLRFEDVKYFLGPVSISAWYPKFYRSIMLYYLKTHFSASDMEGAVTPRNPFFPDYLRCSVEDLLANKTSSVEQFDRFMLRISDNKYRIPTLLKKYLKINSKLIDFNVDPDFNYCVDGLLICKLSDIPQEEILSLAKDDPDIERIKKRYHGMGS